MKSSFVSKLVKIFRGIIGLLFKIYISIVFLIGLFIFYLPIRYFKRSENTKKLCFKIFILWSWLIRIFAFIHVKKLSKQAIPSGPYIIISNHASYLDIFLMYSILPQNPFLFLGKSEILSYPLVKTFFIDLNIPVYRGTGKAARSFVEAKNAVKKGWSLVIFPEGGIPDLDYPIMMPFKDGAFKLAKTLHIPIIPITFKNNHRLFSDPTHILGPARPGLSKVYIHKPISVEEISTQSVEELSRFSYHLISSKL